MIRPRDYDFDLDLDLDFTSTETFPVTKTIQEWMDYYVNSKNHIYPKEFVDKISELFTIYELLSIASLVEHCRKVFEDLPSLLSLKRELFFKPFQVAIETTSYNNFVKDLRAKEGLPVLSLSDSLTLDLKGPLE